MSLLKLCCSWDWVQGGARDPGFWCDTVECDKCGSGGGGNDNIECIPTQVDPGERCSCARAPQAASLLYTRTANTTSPLNSTVATATPKSTWAALGFGIAALVVV